VQRSILEAGYMSGATPVPPRVAYALEWGTVDSPWLFAASARTPEEREALVRAFVAAAGSTPVAPAP
jgi:hypothetical protein